MSLQNLTIFVSAAILVCLSPGPDILTVITRSITQGTWAGIVATFGFATGLIFHTTLAATGLSLVLRQSPGTFHALQILGAAYLVYLAIRLFMERDASPAEKSETPPRTYTRIFGQFVLMNVLNPKVTLFFVAFLGRFVEPDNTMAVWLQMIIFGTLFAACTILCFGTCALIAGRLTLFLRGHPHASRPLRIVTGVVFILLAVTLFFT